MLIEGGFCSALLKLCQEEKQENPLTLPDTHPEQVVEGRSGDAGTVVTSISQSTKRGSGHTEVLPAAADFFKILCFMSA